jgi:hypothetical protein
MSPCNGNSHRASIEQCLAQAELAISPQVAAIWRAIADQYRFTGSAGRDTWLLFQQEIGLRSRRNENMGFGSVETPSMHH